MSKLCMFSSGAKIGITKERNSENEGPIHLAFLHVFAYFEVVPKALRDYIYFATICRHLVECWSPFGAHWILKGADHRPIFQKKTK